tara:strand:- start:298 stop:486 length:189 start_codon:yes stop_codon:yes gene_type:complete
MKFNFLDWMNMSMVVDIAFLVFAAAVVWKFKKLQNKISEQKSLLTLTIKNPQQAKRQLNKTK